jgi:hypothetical protein
MRSITSLRPSSLFALPHGSYTRRMAEHRAVIAGTVGRTADPDAPDDPTPPPPTARGLALRVAFWVLIVLGGIYTVTIESWGHDGVFSIRGWSG